MEDNILQNLHNSSDDAKVEFNDNTVLLFTQNNSQFKNKLIDVKFIFDSARLSESLGDKGLISSANILQIADVFHQVVFSLFLLCFQAIVRLFLPRETSEMFRHFVLTVNKTT